MAAPPPHSAATPSRNSPFARRKSDPKAKQKKQLAILAAGLTVLAMLWFRGGQPRLAKADSPAAETVQTSAGAVRVPDLSEAAMRIRVYRSRQDPPPAADLFDKARLWDRGAADRPQPEVTLVETRAAPETPAFDPVAEQEADLRRERELAVDRLLRDASVLNITSIVAGNNARVLIGSRLAAIGDAVGTPRRLWVEHIDAAGIVVGRDGLYAFVARDGGTPRLVTRKP